MGIEHLYCSLALLLRGKVGLGVSQHLNITNRSYSTRTTVIKWFVANKLKRLAKLAAAALIANFAI